MATHVSFVIGGQSESTAFYFRILDSLETVGYSKKNHLEFCDSITDEEIKNFIQAVVKRFIEKFQKDNADQEKGQIECTELTQEKTFTVKVKKIFHFKHNEVFHVLEEEILMNKKAPVPVL